MGAFLAPSALDLFTRFVARVVDELGDLCDLWCTINEPNVYSVVGYLLGVWPPGHKGDARNTYKVQATLARAIHITILLHWCLQHLRNVKGRGKGCMTCVHRTRIISLS